MQTESTTVEVDRIVRIVKSLPDEKLKALSDILDSWGEKRNRKHPRKQVNVDVDFVVSESRPYKRTARDISVGGIFINCTGDFQVGEETRFVFGLPGFEKPFKLSGTIVRKQEDGIGIEINKLNPYFAEIMEKALSSV
ncbi:MAG: PilZ domain-containing protein [Desulfarculaceae bacterium]|nr:PilZ domain-containing protein [Desulfarculaceae bacterium]